MTSYVSYSLRSKRFMMISQTFWKLLVDFFLLSLMVMGSLLGISCTLVGVPTVPSLERKHFRKILTTFLIVSILVTKSRQLDQKTMVACLF